MAARSYNHLSTRLSRFRVRSNLAALRLSTFVLTGVLAGESDGADKSWGNVLGGTFSNSGNWQGDSVAEAADTAHFGLTTNVLFQRIYTVDFTADATNQALVIEDDFVVFDLNGKAYSTLMDPGIELGTVAGRTGRLTIIDGVLSPALNSTIRIGSVAGAAGNLTIATGGQVFGSPIVYVGLEGRGVLTVNDGGSVLSEFASVGPTAGITGTATVMDVGSTLNTNFLFVGQIGTGTLSITTGGLVASTFAMVGAVDGSHGTVLIDGVGSEWLGTGESTIGADGVGVLTITGGGRAAHPAATIGVFGGSVGEVSVDGGGSQWTLGGNLTVGQDGRGALQVTAGGFVQNVEGIVAASDIGTGQITVDGIGSLWDNLGDVTIGDGGVATLDISNGGRVQNIVGAVSGRPPFDPLADISTARVTGAQSQWFNSSTLRVREGGELSVANGGRVLSASGIISGEFCGSFDCARATVSGVGSEWISQGALFVGFLHGRGVLEITAGGRVESANSFVGDSSFGSFGRVIVRDSGSEWTVGELRVESSNSESRLEIEAGGRVQSSHSDIGFMNDSMASVFVSGDGSNWTILGQLRIGGIRSSERGVLHILPGGTVIVAQGLHLFGCCSEVHLAGGTLDAAAITRASKSSGKFTWVSGTLHTGAFEGDLLNQGGKLAPGHSAGFTLIQGNYTQQQAGAMEIEIGGTAQGTQFDFVNVDGDAQFDGMLQLKLINGFIPSASQILVVFSAASVSGSFDNAPSNQRVHTLDGRGSFVVHYGTFSGHDPDEIVLTDFVRGVRADLDHDGDVDLADFQLFQNCATGSDAAAQATCGQPDFDLDGDVDLSDFELFPPCLDGPGVPGDPSCLP